MEWFIQNKQGQIEGPFSAAEMKQKAGEGEIEQATLVRQSQGKWIRASMVKGLLIESSADGAAVKPPGQAVIPPPLPREGAGSARERASPVAASAKTGWQWQWIVAAGGLVFVLLAACLFVFDRADTRRREQEAANRSVAQAMEAARAWLTKGTPEEAGQVEQRLRSASENPPATQIDGVEPLLAEMQRVKAERLEAVLRMKGTQEATAILQRAKDSIAEQKLAEARSYLTQYRTHPYASERKAALQLIEQSNLAESDTDAKDYLRRLSDSEFERFQATSEFADERITDPVLREVRLSTLNGCLEDLANERREKRLKLEAESRQREAERKVAESIQGAVEERKRLAAEQQRKKEERPKRILAARKQREKDGRAAGIMAPVYQAEMLIDRITSDDPLAEEYLRGCIVLGFLSELHSKGLLEAKYIRQCLNDPRLDGEGKAVTSAKWAVQRFGKYRFPDTSWTVEWLWTEAMIRLEEGDPNE